MVYFSCFPKFVLLFLQLKRYSGLSRFSSVSVVIPRLQTVFTADVSYGNFPRVLPTLPVAVKSTRTSRRCARRAQQPVFALKQFLLKNWWNSLVFLGRRKTHSYIMLKSSTLFASISAFFLSVPQSLAFWPPLSSGCCCILTVGSHGSLYLRVCPRPLYVNSVNLTELCC